MRLYVIFRYVGFVILLNSLFLLVSTLISFFYHETSFVPLLYSTIITILFGIFPIIFVPPIDDINHIEGLLIVVSSWLLSVLIGTIPYVMWGGEFSFTNAIFESVSGYTTTGSTILNQIESLPSGILFWRASTHWIGGMGIIVFVLSVMPSLGSAGLVLYRSEMSPAALRQFKMRSRDAVRIILWVYVGLTAIETILLMFAGMNLFDAITQAFSTVATGGFSTKNASIAAFHSLAVEIIIMVFMLLSGMNFALLFAAVTGKLEEVKASTVLKYYVGANIVVILLVAINLLGHNYTSFWQALRYSSFQVLSVGTSTGFADADSSIWPPFAQMLLVIMTLQCASAGSTSGGIKVDRVVVFLKSVVRKIKQTLHPNAVLNIIMDGKKLDEDLVNSTILYIITYVVIVAISGLLVSAMGVDMISAYSGAAATMGNVGPGLGFLGSLENYSSLPDAAKWVYSFTMILGRLEIYGLIIFLLPSTWRRKA